MRLLLGNVKDAVWQTALLVAVLLWALLDDYNARPLAAWATAILGLELFSAWDARRALRRLDATTWQSQVRRQMALNLADGLLWASLTWITLDTAGLGGSVLVIAVMAGVAGSAMSSLAVVMPVFLCFLATLLLTIAAKLWLLKDPAYGALALTGILYCMTLVGHGRNLAQSARAAIDLRFENLELIARLLRESENAREAHRAADESNLAKSKFLAAASHDLRQPIHAQGLFLTVLERSALTPAQRGILQSVTSATRATAEMLNTLLDFSRIEAGVVQAEVRPLELQPLLNVIENELAPQADAKGIVYRSRETRAVVRSDSAILALILRNLVSNAIRYTERGGLLIGCRLRDGHALLEVWDTGIGIAPADRDAVFREFHQLGNPERDRRKGLGLGLAIAQQLARTLGHALTLDSEPGRGSVFRIELPLAPRGELPAARPRWTAVASIAGARVLVIDDDEAVREAMRQLLRDWGCECDAADGIADALELAARVLPDVVISDYRLRGTSTGADAIAALRAVHGPQLAALLVTGDTAPERLREAGASGMTLLHKPVHPRELQLALAGVLREGSAGG
ncbi:response regulator [Ramlibacter sp. G-1-2-2]|uniref:histidine kinase n=2 Tax=Ramlibacter agri TaxID=2728837 RepID=A0A848H3F2_9BURK|nr:response regulator [Ramlibacter agri]